MAPLFRSVACCFLGVRFTLWRIRGKIISESYRFFDATAFCKAVVDRWAACFNSLFYADYCTGSHSFKSRPFLYCCSCKSFCIILLAGMPDACRRPDQSVDSVFLSTDRYGFVHFTAVFLDPKHSKISQRLFCRFSSVYCGAMCGWICSDAVYRCGIVRICWKGEA